MSLILDALKRRPRAAERQASHPTRTAHADVVLETLGSPRRRSPLGRWFEVSRFILYAFAGLLLLLAVWALSLKP